MPTNTPSHHSTVLSRALELRFVGDLSAALWRNGCRDFEILRSETDTGGYDVVVDAKGIVRHIQLKATVAGGKRRSVTVNTRLADKPAGCVVWMNYDPETLQLCDFRFLGAEPRKPLPPIGDKVARHTKANADGYKTHRPGHRVVRQAVFSPPESVEALAARLFGPGCSSRANGHEPQKLSIGLLLRHLRQRAEEEPLSPNAPSWLGQVQAGDFTAIPPTLAWKNAAVFAHLIDGYALCEEAGLGDPFEYEGIKRDESQRVGCWTGSALELWVCLFLEYRQDRFQGGWPRGDEPQLDALCRDLRARLIRES